MRAGEGFSRKRVSFPGKKISHRRLDCEAQTEPASGARTLWRKAWSRQRASAAKKGRARRGNAQVDRVVCRGRRTGEERCRPKMRLGGAIEGSHRPWGALRRSFATLAPANRAEIAPRTGTAGKLTPLPFSSFNPDLKRVTHWREKFHISYEYSICELNK